MASSDETQRKRTAKSRAFLIALVATHLLAVLLAAIVVYSMFFA